MSRCQEKQEKIIECIPNFSEGRDKKKIQAILDAITSILGVILLDHESDAAHNRSVVTFIGGPEAVFDAAFAATKKAAQIIDMDKHKGEHPRIGAIDVVPFVPIQGVTNEECIQIAVRFAKKVGSELSIPVYLYEQAARVPERTNLADIRKGEYETIKKEIGSIASRAPDFGPRRIGKAGATAVGVRDPLVAYNVNLKSRDLELAKTIAKKVRGRDGGFPCVKAMGFDLADQGMVQVSMNLTDYKTTPPHTVFDAISREADAHGVRVAESEIVGLVPEEPLIEAAKHYLKLNGFKNDQILEKILEKKRALHEGAHFSPPYEGGVVAAGDRGGRLHGSRLADLRITEFLDEVASKKPIPGGGSVAALAAACAAALTTMVCQITLASAKYFKSHVRAKKIMEKTEALHRELTQLIDEDSASYQTVVTAYKLPDGPAKTRALEKAFKYAASVPLKTAQSALALKDSIAVITKIGNQNALSDCGVALHLIEAAVKGALLNVRINLKFIKNKKIAAALKKKCMAIEKKL